MASLSSAVPSCCVCWSSLSVTGSGARTTYLTVATMATVRKKKRQKRDDDALTAICAFLLFLRPAARLAFAADAWLVIVLLSHLVAPIIFLLVYNNAFYPARRNCARVILPRGSHTLMLDAKSRKKVSKSLCIFFRVAMPPRMWRWALLTSSTSFDLQV